MNLMTILSSYMLFNGVMIFFLFITFIRTFLLISSYSKLYFFKSILQSNVLF